MNEESLTVEQAAAKLGVRGRTIREWLATGELEGTRVNARLWLIPKRAVDAHPSGPRRRGPKPREPRGSA